MDFLSQLSASNVELSDLTLRLLVVLIVVLIERRFAIDASYHPGTLWRFIALKLAKKTAKNSPKQQRLSGAISTVMLLFIGIVIVYTILVFAIYPWFFDAIFLLLAINSYSILRHCKSVYQSLKHNKKNLAKEQLTSLCVRDTQSLSTMGIVKATIEGAVQQFSLNYLIPITLYLLTGSIGLIIYGLLNALGRYWNPKQKAWRHFGKFPQYLMGLISLPFHCLQALLIAFLFGFKHLSIKRNSWHRFGTGALLATTANAMNRELGGAVMYDGIKIRRRKLGTRYHPDIADLPHLYRLLMKLRQSILIVVFITFLFSTLLSL